VSWRVEIFCGAGLMAARHAVPGTVDREDGYPQIPIERVYLLSKEIFAWTGLLRSASGAYLKPL
jgi:hypothetical protein